MLAMEFGIELEVVHRARPRTRCSTPSRRDSLGEPAAPAAGDHDPGARRPRQDLASGPHPQVERRPVRERRHHPAHRRLPGRVQRPADHVRRHARPRGVHLDAGPRRQRHRHRGAGRRRRRRRDAPDHRGHRPRQGGRRADRGGAQQDRPAQRRHRRRTSTRSTASCRSRGLHPVEWGGDTEVVKTSATSGQGIPDLLATLETIAELHELKADPTRPATGTCLEASLSEGRGVLASRAGPGRDPPGRRRDRLRRRLRPRPRPVRRQGTLDRRGRPVDPRRGLGAGRRPHRRRELRRRRRHLPRPRGRRGSPAPRPRRRPRRPPGRHAGKPLLARWPSRSSRAST